MNTTQPGADNALDLDAIEAAARAATPGPWEWGGTECASPEQALAICKENLDATAKPGTHFCEVFLADGRRTALVGNGPTGIENAAFIAAANPQSVLALIALARRAAQPVEQMESAFKIALGSLALHDMEEAARIGKMYRDSLATHPAEPVCTICADAPAEIGEACALCHWKTPAVPAVKSRSQDD